MPDPWENFVETEEPAPPQQEKSPANDWSQFVEGKTAAPEGVAPRYAGEPDITGDRATYQIPIQERIGGWWGRSFGDVNRAAQKLEGWNKTAREAPGAALEWAT